MKRWIRGRERGQGMTEYIIIVVFIAVLSIFVVTLFGDNIRALFGASANAIIGKETSPTDLGAEEVTEEAVKRDIDSLGDSP